MTPRPFLLSTLCALAALTAACDGDNSVRITSTRNESDAKGVLKVVDALQCPQTMGSLTRKGSAQDGGKVCTYVGPKGTEVSLHLVALDGETPADVLKTFETRLSASLPAAVAQLQASTDAEKARMQADIARADADTAAARADTAAVSADQAAVRADAAAASTDRATVRAPGVMIDANGDDATVRLPGMRIETRGDQASVRIGGFHIDANDTDGSARVTGSSGGGDSVTINAQNDAAEIRTSASGEATRVSWILTDNRETETGWRMVAFEARGPVGGPLVVATIRSRDANRGRAFEDARDLVTLNVGE
ncbi:MAG: methyltransferase type 11 [Brevundimonas sp.]|uniref:methyltransferase type 11 n=1 Tax=Brevundimonas sp. TaxID=1871086 RepID=UPI0024879BA7|nr:methyltransferase type 11 [Brevundimonas sp.]MDI1326427.1 methyltransferase type 11 [Brevundimonas sp.]